MYTLSGGKSRQQETEVSDCVVSLTEESDMCMHAAQLFSPFHPIQGPAHEMVLLKFRASLPHSANPARSLPGMLRHPSLMGF